MTVEAETGLRHPPISRGMPKIVGKYQKPEYVRKDSPLQVSEGAGPC